MIKIKFVGKIVGEIVKEFAHEEELYQWLKKYMVEYDIIESYKWVDGKWVKH